MMIILGISILTHLFLLSFRSLFHLITFHLALSLALCSNEKIHIVSSVDNDGSTQVKFQDPPILKEVFVMFFLIGCF